jgi:hypothetical protein
MGEPQRSDAPESDRRSYPRFAAELLGKHSVRLLGGSEVTLINFSERGLLFQSETRLLVGARGTVRIVVGTDTTIAAGTVVRSLVQGMASGKLAFHTALALDQPLALAAAVEARERAKAPAARPAPPPAPVEPPPVEPVAAPPAGKTIEKKSKKLAAAKAPEPEPAPPVPEPAPEAPPVAREVTAPPPLPVAAPASEPPAPVSDRNGGGFGDDGFGGGSFGWADTAEPASAALSVLFVSTTKERTSRVQGVLASHAHDIALTTIVHSKADALAEIACQHDVLLFDFAIGPDALERTLTALRSSPLGASIAIFVPTRTELPASVSSLANACVIETPSGELLAAALRDAAWTPWQPVETPAGATPRDDLFWKAFDALPVPVLVVDDGGAIVHANAACARLAEGVELDGRALASLFVPGDAGAIAALIANGLAGGQHDAPVLTAPADGGSSTQVVLQALSVLPGAAGRAELAVRCELRAEAPAAVVPAGPDLAAEIAALTENRDELTQIVAAAGAELTLRREELEEARGQIAAARRERDELRGQLEIAQRDLERARELERAGAAKVTGLERALSDASLAETALGRAQGQQAAAVEELRTVRAELDALKARVDGEAAEAGRTASRYTAIEAGARQAIDELKTARSEVQRLTRERDQALAAVEAERAKASTAAAAAVRDEGRRGRKLVTDDAAAASAAKLQRQVDELRAELKQEQDARRELEELLDQNAENLEQTIQDYEAKLEALGAGAEDKRAKPKKSQRG